MEDNRKTPPFYIYPGLEGDSFQRNVCIRNCGCTVDLGAFHLARISELQKKRYLGITSGELKKRLKTETPLKVDIREFSHGLRLLGACHLENFLCIFHNMLEAYADFLEKRKIKNNQNKFTND